MKQKIFIALIALAAAVLVHGYLTAHYYPLHLGFGGSASLCSIGASFDCDAVSASPYASIAGIPLAAFGMVYNLLLFVMVLMTWLGLRGESPRCWRGPLWMASGSLLASVVMGFITVAFLKSLCLFCIIAYALSVLTFGALLWAQPESPWRHFGEDLKSWLTDSKSFLVWPAMVPVGAVLVNIGMMQNYGAEELNRVVKTAVLDWQHQTPVTWAANPSLTKGASVEDAKLTLTEFADFRCGHCAQAAPSLSAFVKANPDVRLVFYSFPLDGACNSAIGQGDGMSCHLAKTVLCAGQQEKGWQTHDYIFQNQSNFQALSTAEAINTELKGKLAAESIDWTALEACQKDPATEENIKAQAAQGVAAKVQGTPTVYANGKKLERGSLLPVLSAVRETVLNQK